MRAGRTPPNRRALPSRGLQKAGSPRSFDPQGFRERTALSSPASRRARWPRCKIVATQLCSAVHESPTRCSREAGQKAQSSKPRTSSFAKAAELGGKINLHRSFRAKCIFLRAANERHEKIGKCATRRGEAADEAGEGRDAARVAGEECEQPPRGPAPSFDVEPFGEGHGQSFAGGIAYHAGPGQRHTRARAGGGGRSGFHVP